MPQPPLQECVRAFEDQFGYVCRTLRSYGVPEADVPDLAQEVFIVMWRRWSDFDQRRALRPWLAGIAFNVAGSHFRRHQRREVPLADPETLDPSPHGEDGLAAARARRVVLQALQHLPDPYRTVLVLRDIDGVPMRQIAALQRVPLFTAYTRLRKARRDFAAAVLQQEPDRPSERRRALLPWFALEPATGPGRARLAPAGWVRLFWQVGLTALAAAGLLWFSLPPSERGQALGAAGPAPWAEAAPVRGRAVRPMRPLPAPRDLPRLASVLPAPSQPVELSLDRGLTGYWPLDEARGATVRDLSGRRGDCRLRTQEPGDPWMTGQQGAALQFGARSWLECPQPDLLDGATGEATVAVWVKPRSIGGRHNIRAVVTRQVGTGSADHFYLGFTDGLLTLNSYSWGVVLRRPVEVEGRWHHLAFTKSHTRAKLFLDGRVLMGQNIRLLRHDPVDTPVIIGGGSNTPGVVRELFDGAIDDVRMYGRALSEAEVAALAAGTQPEPAGGE